MLPFQVPLLPLLYSAVAPSPPQGLPPSVSSSGLEQKQKHDPQNPGSNQASYKTSLLDELVLMKVCLLATENMRNACLWGIKSHHQVPQKGSRAQKMVKKVKVHRFTNTGKPRQSQLQTTSGFFLRETWYLYGLRHLRTPNKWKQTQIQREE